MAPRKGRHATKQSATNTPNFSPATLLSEIDTPSPASFAEELPVFQLEQAREFELTRELSPEPQIDVVADQLDLIDMHGHSGRVRGDMDELPAPRALPSPPVLAFDLSEPAVLPVTSAERHEAGHVRSPVLVREPTMLENLSRTVRNYVPSSIPIPSSSSPPSRSSRPLSLGNFMTPNIISSSPAPVSPIMTTTATPKHRGNDWRARNATTGHYHGVGGLDDVFASDEEVEAALSPLGAPALGTRSSSNASNTSYPGANNGDAILWSRWDQLRDGTGTRRLLFLGYSTGLQVWDCTKLGSVVEIFNLAGAGWGRVTFAGILPSPTPTTLRGDPFVEQRPLIGLVTGSREESMLSIYSLRSHEVVKTLGISDVHSFSSNDRFTAICTTTPPTIHILSSISLTTLHVLPAAILSPFAHSISASSNNKANNTNNNNNNVSSIVSSASISPLDRLAAVYNATPQQPQLIEQHPRPVFALSHRLLAYASAPPRPESASGPTSRPLPHSRPPSGTFGVTQADLGNAALKVGGSMLSGMKSLGGMAYSAAKARVAPGSPIVEQQGASGLSNMFFSRSAPTGSGDSHARRTSISIGGQGQSPPDPAFSHPVASSKSGYHITVLDLAPLLASSARAPAQPAVIAEFVASKRHPISDIQFTADGNALIVSTDDGKVARVFHIRPATLASKLATAKDSEVRSDPWHMYDLRRGHTSAVIEGVGGSEDGRWVAVGTRKRTVHIFAVNPYGGKADHRSHLEGRVRNVDEIQPLSTEVIPIVRLRALKFPLPEQPRVPLAFTFIQSSEAALPTTLLPPATLTYSAPTSVHSSPVMHAEPLSPHRLHRPANYQDVLVFDPTDGSLSLRRFMVELRSRDQLSFPSAVGGTSISLPGISLSGRLGISPPSAGNKPSGLSQMMETPTELVAKPSILASWNLKRGSDWTEIHWTVKPATVVAHRGSPSKSNSSLAHAELSMSPKSHRLVPRPIYLSHQFFFHALGEDYHALIRRFHLDIDGKKIEVRSEVSASAYSGGTGENFVEEFSATRDSMHHPSTSFDGPLASALSAGLDYTHPSPTIPMLPNGTPGAKQSFRSPMPIRTMATGFSDGMTESIGRIRREMHKVRPPILGPRSDVSSSVPLEFDEEEEDFMDSGDLLRVRDESFSRSNSRGDGSAASVSTPSTSAAPLDEETEEWQHGWNAEDKLVIDEAEQFNDVVGFLDEDQPTVPAERKKRSRRRAAS